MPKNEDVKTEEQTKELCVHFDTKEHRITLDEFIQTVQTYETIANNIADNIFDVKKGIKIYILPPKKGSFILSLLLWLSSTAVAGIVGNLASDSVRDFVKGVTKKLNSKKSLDSLNIPNSAEVLGETITGFLMETYDDINTLDKYIPKGRNIDASIKAKADFYNMCSSNKDILGLGFTDDDKSELKRADFVLRGVQPTIKPLPIKVELQELTIVKPVTVEEDLQWDLKDKNTKESLTAKMADENFKEMLFNGKCPQRKNSTPDIITAKVEYHNNLKNGKESKAEYIITDVYKFNNKTLKEIPKGLKLNKKEKLEDVNNEKQLHLFDEDNNDK